MAVLGLVNHALGATRILWLPKWPELNRLTATFLNPNHQALYFAICLFLALGLILRPGRDGRATVIGAPGAGGGASRRLPATVVLIGAVLVMAAALTLTLSRGAIVSALGGVMTLVLLLAASRGRSRLPLLILGGLVAFTAYAAWAGMDAAAARLVGVAREPFGDLRFSVWDATLRMSVERPVLGVGLGAYQDAFTRFRPTAVPVDKFVDFAHNDYLQLLAETGVIGLGVLLWAMVATGVWVFRRFVTRRDPLVKGLTAGALSALAATAFHSLLDFGLHRPANALLIVLVTALAPAVASWHVHRTGESVDLPEWRWAVGARGRALGFGVVTAGLAVAALWVVPPGIADWRYQSAFERASQFERARGAVSLHEFTEARRDLEQAVAWDPRNPRAQAALAQVLDELATRTWTTGIDADGRRLADDTVIGRFRATDPLFAGAYAAYQQSLAQRPLAAEVHQSFGWFLARVDRLRRAVQGTTVASADSGFDALLQSDESLLARGLAEASLGARLDPNSALRQRALGEYALTFPVAEPDGRRVAIEAYRRALTIDPRFLPYVVDDLLAHRADQELLLEAVPRTYTLRLELARQLDRRGRWTAAWAAFEDSTTLAAMPAQEVEARIAYGQALLRRAERDRALVQARQALVVAPNRPDVFLLLGEVYESLGQVAEAEGAFTSAVTVVGLDTSRKANQYRARLASFLAQRGAGDRAIALWRQVLKAMPNDPWLRLELALTLQARGDTNGAFIEYQTAASLGPADWGLQWEVGRAMARAGHLREAIAAYESADRLAPPLPELQTELAELLARGGWPDRAAARYRRVLAIRPEHEGARRGLATLTAAGGAGR
jgi:tetratricopeptide (TPR) repeat protein/O-antigen ligase